MTTKVTDEMLMAYVDGEVDAATRKDVLRTVEADPKLAARLREFEETRRLARLAYRDIIETPAPERLVGSILNAGRADDREEAASKVVAFPRRRMMMAALPLAASIALVFGAGGYWWGQSGGSGPADVLGPSAVAEALSETASGEATAVEIAGAESYLDSLATYRVVGGICRTFDLSGGSLETPLRGVGCGRGEVWTVDMAVAFGGQDTYSPASAGLAESINVYLDSLEAEGPLAPEDEE